MKSKRSVVMIIGTGKVIEVKDSPFGYIDCKGNFYHRNVVQFIRVLE